MQENKYCEYFNVIEDYFPCIDESAINAGVDWEVTYPHDTFIDLIDSAEKMLGGATNKSLWIHGAYGTGKSRCAYTLKKILEVPEDELRSYWDKYDPLKKKKVLLEKMIGHKERGIITAFRYASGSITTSQQLFLAVQESIYDAIMADDRVSYKGEKSLKEIVIAWLEEPIHNDIFNKLLQRPKWMSLFSQSSADEVINSLKKSGDVTELMNNIATLAAEEGLKILTINADSLRDWIIDILKTNDMKLVLIWDEFSDFFRQNRNSLGELQKLVSICQEAPFYFVIVTHPITSLSSSDESWKIIQQRFDKVEITLPPNIGFKLIGQAFSVKSVAENAWKSILTTDLNARVTSSRKAVMKAADIEDEKVMEDIIPIHPMAALVLKNIATAFQSNQRSMFDFIKTPDELDLKAFQWFIKNTGPMSDRPLLTVDMLWNFFYEKGKDYLSSDIKLILDTFPQQTALFEDEKIVLKTILIMQAIDQRLGGAVPVLKPTDQNLSYAFEGDYPKYEHECRNIAKALVTKGVLIQTPIADGKKVYSAAVLAGDGAKIDNYKNDIRKNSTTLKLVSEAEGLKTALALTPALKLRFAMDIDEGSLPVVTSSDFEKTMNALSNKDSNWHFYAVLALAKTEEEAQSFRTQIKQTIKDPQYKNIAVIDALSTPLGLDAFEEYVGFSAMATYYGSNNGQQSKDNARKAKEVLERDWKNRIHDGQFIVYTYDNQDGEKATGAAAVQTIMQTIVLTKYPHTFDFAKGLKESQLKNTQAKKSARAGMADQTVTGIVAGCDKLLLSKVWSRENYWSVPELQSESIVIIKKAIDRIVKESFDNSGKISIDEIYDYLESTYGFAPSNVTAFITAFLLKEYNSDPYRSLDEDGHRESMTPDKLAEMIGNYIGKNPKPTYIVSLTDDEKAFYSLTEEAWSLEPNSCSSPSHASSLVRGKMRELGYPVWCLEDVDTLGAYDLVKKYIALVQSKGDDAHDIANSIGKIARQRPSSAADLKSLLTVENCRKGMVLFLERFNEGNLIHIAEEIGAKEQVLPDIKKMFDVEYSSLWEGETGEDEIHKLEVEYEVIKTTNTLLNVSAHNKDEAMNAWKETLKFLGSSCDAICSKKPSLDPLFKILLKIANNEELLPENMKAFLLELQKHNTDIRDILSDSLGLFIEIYGPYIEGLERIEVEEVKNSIKVDMFTLSTTQSNVTVKKAAEDFKKNQVRTQMYNLWSEKTGGSKNPRDWSYIHKTPILCCVPAAEYSKAKSAFTTINGNSQTESEIKNAISYIENATFLDKLDDSDFRDRKFMESIAGDYATLLTEIGIIREKLEKLAIDPYEWNDSPLVQEKIHEMALAEYNAGGSDEVFSIIEKMGDEKLIAWLKDLAKSDIDLGIMLLKSGGKN